MGLTISWRAGLRIGHDVIEPERLTKLGTRAAPVVDHAPPSGGVVVPLLGYAPCGRTMREERARDRDKEATIIVAHHAPRLSTTCATAIRSNAAKSAVATLAGCRLSTRVAARSSGSGRPPAS